MPRGKRPSTAALTMSGARNASEMVIFTCRTLHFWRVAICSMLAGEPETISSSQRRPRAIARSEEHTSELQSRQYLVCRLLLEKKKKNERKTVEILKTQRRR